MYIIPLIVIAGGLYLWCRELLVRRRFQETRARITRSEVGQFNTHPPKYFPSIAFSYEANGQKYEDGRYHLFLQLNRVSAKVRKACEQFPLGSEAPAWFDPKNPSVAVLDRSVSRTGPGAVVIGLAILALIYFRGA